MAGTSVTEQLAARKAAQGAKPTGKTTPSASAKPSGRSRAAKPAETKPEPETPAAGETKPSGRTKVERTPEEQAKYLEAKKAKKEAAFEKLRKMNEQKKAARRVGLEQTLSEAKAELMPDGKPGKVLYSTRASYYGVRCVVQDVIELRGRILVSVLCTTTKGGQDLEPDRYYARNFGLEFLQDEPVTEEYVPRREGTKRAEKFDKKKAREAKKARKEARAKAKAEGGESEEEEEAELEDLDLEAEEDDEDVDLEEDEEDDEDEDEEDDEDEDDEEEAEGTETEASDEAEEDSWG